MVAGVNPEPEGAPRNDKQQTSQSEPSTPNKKASPCKSAFSLAPPGTLHQVLTRFKSEVFDFHLKQLAQQDAELSQTALASSTEFGSTEFDSKAWLERFPGLVVTSSFGSRDGSAIDLAERMYRRLVLLAGQLRGGTSSDETKLRTEAEALKAALKEIKPYVDSEACVSVERRLSLLRTAKTVVDAIYADRSGTDTQRSEVLCQALDQLLSEEPGLYRKLLNGLELIVEFERWGVVRHAMQRVMTPHQVRNENELLEFISHHLNACIDAHNYAVQSDRVKSMSTLATEEVEARFDELRRAMAQELKYATDWQLPDSTAALVRRALSLPILELKGNYVDGRAESAGPFTHYCQAEIRACLHPAFVMWRPISDARRQKDLAKRDETWAPFGYIPLDPERIPMFQASDLVKNPTSAAGVRGRFGYALFPIIRGTSLTATEEPLSTKHHSHPSFQLRITGPTPSAPKKSFPANLARVLADRFDYFDDDSLGCWSTSRPKELLGMISTTVQGAAKMEYPELDLVLLDGATGRCEPVPAGAGSPHFSADRETGWVHFKGRTVDKTGKIYLLEVDIELIAVIPPDSYEMYTRRPRPLS